MVSGSGAQSRDEEIAGHKPFAVIADYFARHGIAAYCFDFRGGGGSRSEGSTTEMSVMTESGRERLILKVGCIQPRLKWRHI